MLGSREKMVVISSSTSGINEWPQNNNQMVDEKSLMMASTTTKVALSQLPQDQQQHQQQQQQHQQQQQALKCPRCDSSNTKFCYYNNYSLSQPRHFCKACKRYWTRGGTLRNVPVGGGCRKNKRVKRPAASSSTINDGPKNNSVSSSNPNPQTPIDINPLFYGLTTNNPSELNLPIFPGSRFDSSVESAVSAGFHDLQPQLNALALGFSSGIQDAVTSNSLLSSYSNLFGSSTSTNTTTTSPTIASLLASSLHQHKFTNNGAGIKESSTLNNHFQSLAVLPFEDLQMSSNSTESGNISMKGLVKVEQDHQINRLDHHWNYMPCHQNQIEQIGFSSDPSSLYWNTGTTGVNVGSWHHDPTNIGSSVTSLI